ncbi:MAG: hypothetical protein FWF12_00255 [Betaproteobacteria bacterium]|nr:hypothetical protein [Betaproteobacteria bacterium]
MNTHEINLSANTDDALIASMLDNIGDDETLTLFDDDEINASGVIGLDDDAAIEAAVAAIEKAEAIQELYSEEGDAAANEPAFEADVPKPAKAAKEKKAKAPKEPKPAKEPKAPAVRYNGRRSNTSDVLKARLGEKANEMLILEVEDASLSPADLEAKQSELLALLNTRPGSDGASSQQKVAEKVVMLFNWLKNGGTLNRVMDITFRLLIKDGEIQSGEKGNLWTALLAKPYSKGTTSAQGGQMMSMLPMLKIATKGDKGRLIANPNSMVLMAVKAQLGL